MSLLQLFCTNSIKETQRSTEMKCFNSQTKTLYRTTTKHSAELGYGNTWVSVLTFGIYFLRRHSHMVTYMVKHS